MFFFIFSDFLNIFVQIPSFWHPPWTLKTTPYIVTNNQHHPYFFPRSSTWVLFRPYLANRCPDRSYLFCAGRPLFTPFSGLPELAERSTIGCVLPNSAWHSQNPHISSVLGENFVEFYGLWLVVKQRLTRFWEALIRVKRTGGSCITMPSPQQPFFLPHRHNLLTSNLYNAFKRLDCTFPTHLFASITDKTLVYSMHFTPELRFLGSSSLSPRPRLVTIRELYCWKGTFYSFRTRIWSSKTSQKSLCYAQMQFWLPQDLPSILGDKIWLEDSYRLV